MNRCISVMVDDIYCKMFGFKHTRHCKLYFKMFNMNIWNYKIGHGTMVCAVCFAVFVRTRWRKIDFPLGNRNLKSNCCRQYSSQTVYDCMIQILKREVHYGYIPSGYNSARAWQQPYYDLCKVIIWLNSCKFNLGKSYLDHLTEV